LMSASSRSDQPSFEPSIAIDPPCAAGTPRRREDHRRMGRAMQRSRALLQLGEVLIVVDRVDVLVAAARARGLEALAPGAA
jgi:hypothetical protein